MRSLPSGRRGSLPADIVDRTRNGGGRRKTPTQAGMRYARRDSGPGDGVAPNVGSAAEVSSRLQPRRTHVAAAPLLDTDPSRC
jgi:hypothetical protein